MIVRLVICILALSAQLAHGIGFYNPKISPELNTKFNGEASIIVGFISLIYGTFGHVNPKGNKMLNKPLIKEEHVSLVQCFQIFFGIILILIGFAVIY